MKKYVLALICSFSAFAYAGETVSAAVPVGVSTAQGQQQSSEQASSSAAVNSGVNQNIVFTSPAETTTNVVQSGTQVIKNTPSLGVAPLTAANDTCHGSVAATVVAPGWGIGGGKTYVNENCELLNNVRTFHMMRMSAAALALMCTDDRNNYALEVTGYKCPVSMREWKALKRAEKREAGEEVVLSDDEKYTDPIIRARLGLK